MNIDSYSKLAGNIEDALDEADEVAKNTTKRLSHEDVFSKLREIANGEEVSDKISSSLAVASYILGTLHNPSAALNLVDDVERAISCRDLNLQKSLRNISLKR